MIKKNMLWYDMVWHGSIEEYERLLYEPIILIKKNVINIHLKMVDDGHIGDKDNDTRSNRGEYSFKPPQKHNDRITTDISH